MSLEEFMEISGWGAWGALAGLFAKWLLLG